MTLIRYISKYFLLMTLATIILCVTWLLKIKNLIFIFFIEASLLFVGDYLIKQRNPEELKALYISKFRFSEDKFKSFMKASRIEFVFGCLFIVLADTALISYPRGVQNLLLPKSILSVLIVGLGLFLVTIKDNNKFKITHSFLRTIISFVGFLVVLVGFFLTFF